ncbi:hypothetical protein FOL47_010198 [Perkinsus chesapeaki]|uniref:Branched-chain-amino-acid aminotransferase n=1 Tax=Perkinsus chesapeaki TaxID=330153 RepID=A0A7J6MQV4_PERCH|nr:hypothetical protein FOL47_010198 [Perkinsus chesapeaki]
MLARLSRRGLVTAAARPPTHHRIDQSSIEFTSAPRLSALPPLDTLEFGKKFSDHMLEIDYNLVNGWGTPRIVPMGNLSVHPASHVLHYAVQCFEGTKVYKVPDGVREFRLASNIARFANSIRRSAMADLTKEDETALYELIRELVLIDEHMIPSDPGYSLYLRPTCIGTQPTLGVFPPTDAKIFVISSPVGPYYKSGFKPVSLLASTKSVRAWPGSTGAQKVGSNYGPTLLPLREAVEQGFSQILWLLPTDATAEDYFVTEVGTMNLFVAMRHSDGIEVVTPPLSDVILPGITRDSALQILRAEEDRHKLKVSERHITINEIVDAYDRGDLLEIFGTGTAAIVCPVKLIHFKGQDIHVPVDEELGAGPICKYVLDVSAEITCATLFYRSKTLTVVCFVTGCLVLAIALGRGFAVLNSDLRGHVPSAGPTDDAFTIFTTDIIIYTVAAVLGLSFLTIGGFVLSAKCVCRGNTGIGRFIRIASPEITLYTIAMLSLYAAAATNLAMPRLFGAIINLVSVPSAMSPTEKRSRLNEEVFELLVCLILANAFSGIRATSFSIAGERIVARLRKELFSSLLHQEVAMFDEIKSGELTSRLSNDVTTLQDALTVNVSVGVRSLASVIGGTIILFIISSKLTLIMLSIVPLAAIATMCYAKFVGKLSKGYQKELANSTEVATEALGSIRVVKTFPKGEAKAEARYAAHVDESYGIGVRKSFGLGGFSWVVGMMIFTAMTSVVWYGAGLVLEGEMLPGTLMSFLFYTFGSIGGSVAGLSEVFSKLAETIGATVKVFEYIDRRPQQASLTEVASDEVYQPLVCNGSLSFTEVWFAYPARSDLHVLKGITFTIQPGQTVALVGHSGAGKSTCISLILRFYDPNSGIIALDGRSLATLKDDCLRRNVSLVAQEPVLFSTSIMDNIKYGAADDITLDEVEASARAAHCHDFIMSFPEGYNTLVGERGVQLSGGQKQRVAIARAMAASPKILLLDEATSALDAENERKVQEALDELSSSRTTIVVAHRLSTVQRADVVIYIEDGRVAEQGTHHQLLAIEDGRYANLVRQQLHGSILE